MSAIVDLLAQRDRLHERRAVARAVLLALLPRTTLPGYGLQVRRAVDEVRACARELHATEQAIAMRCAGVVAVRGLS